MKNKNDIINELKRLSAFIETSHAKLNDNQKIEDLSLLDGDVEKLCNAITALPTLDAQSVQPLMAEMITKLEAFGIALQEFKTRLKGSVD